MAANVSVGQEAQMCMNACAADRGMAAKDNNGFILIVIHSFFSACCLYFRCYYIDVRHLCTFRLHVGMFCTGAMQST